METLYVDGWSEVPEIYAGLEEDIAALDFVPFLGGELDKLAETHREFFRKQTGPDDLRWAPNAKSTIRRKGHSRVLRGIPTNNYRLSRSLTVTGRRSDGDAIREAIQTDTGGHLSFGTAVEYSMFHDVERDNIPARRHVGINERHLDAIVERAVDYVIAELAKG